MPPHLLARAMAWCLLALLLVLAFGCAAEEKPKVLKAPGEWPLIQLEALQPMVLQIPPDFVIDRKPGPDYLVFYIRPPNSDPLSVGGNLGIYTGYEPTSFCGETLMGEPVTIAGWQGKWSSCTSPDSGLHMLETFPGAPFTMKVHIFLVADNSKLDETFRLIVSSLRPAK